MGAYEYPKGCFVSITADHDMYIGSDEMTLHLTAGAFALTELVDIYAAIAFRGRDLLFVPNSTIDWVPWFSGVELQEGPVFSKSFIYPFAGTEPDGISFVYAAAFPHDSSDLADPLTNVASCSFRYHRAGTAEFHIMEDGTGDFATIQEAIDASLNGDTIVVHPGKFRESIDSLGKSITIRSTEPRDPQAALSTIIQGRSYQAPVVTIGSAKDALCIIAGLTITRGYAGIYGSSSYSKVRVSNCILSHNDASNVFGGSYGCGIYGCTGDVEGCIIENNRWLGISGFSGNIRDCVVTNNAGGGLCSCTGEIVNCLVSGNTTTWSGGGMSYCSGNIMNCTIVGNSAGEYGGGVRACDGPIQNCIIWGNNAPDRAEIAGSSEIRYCCIANWDDGGEGNISDDPHVRSRPVRGLLPRPQ